MKYIFFSLVALIVAIYGFVVAPMFIVGVDLRHIPVVDITPQAIEARKNINKVKEEKLSVSSEDLDKWSAAINSQPIKEYTDKELYNIAQRNFLWFSWAPVFLLFCFISREKIKYYFSFVGVLIIAYVAELLILETLLSYSGAAFLGLSLVEVITRINENKLA